MSGSLNKSLEKQGIVTILGSDCCERTNKLAKVTSLRRTLSADMSSKKWLAQHGFSSMKKIASSEELSLAFVDDHDSKEEDYDYEQKMIKDEDEKPGQFDIWSSIISQNKANNNKDIPEPPPYVHPLVKRSSSSLSEKSLKICTESLGSETGSDVFSSYQTSETGDVESDKEEEDHDQKAQLPQQEQHQEKVSQPLFDGIEDQYGTTKSGKYNYSARKLPPRSFPPPLPILSQSDGASLHMRMHRDNGRLVLQAESIPLQKNFSAQRQSGRLVLTFVNNSIDHSELKHEEIVEGKTTIDDQEFEEEFGNFEEEEGEKAREIDDDDDDEEEEEEEEVFKEVSKENNRSREIDIVVMKQAQNMTTTRVTSVHRLALMMNKPIGLANRLNKFNEVVKFEGLKEELVVESAPLPKSLPPRPPVARSTSSTPAVAKEAATAASFNAYEYFWRAKPSHNMEGKSGKLSVPNDEMVAKNNQQEQQQMVVLRGNKAEYVVPLIKGCKEARRSLLFWEPYCVATS